MKHLVQKHRLAGLMSLQLIALVLVSAVAIGAGGVVASPDRSGQDASVARYSVHELTLPHPSSGIRNPWEEVTVTVALHSPSRTLTIGGFYDGVDTWKARVAPDEVGRWTWSASIADRHGIRYVTGQFNVVDSGEPGFVQPDPANPRLFVTSNGQAFHPIGYQHSLSDDTGNGTPFDEIGFDGQDVGQCSSDARCITVRRHDGTVRWSGWVTDLNTETTAFGRDGAGFNVYRWSVDNASFNLFERLGPSGNVYLEREGRWGDELLQTLRAQGIRVYMTILGSSTGCAGGSHHTADPAAAPHQPGQAAGHNWPRLTTACLDAQKRYAEYVVDRYGAYVDFWELRNEASHVADADDTELAATMRARDPYKHRIATSWKKPALPAIEIDAPHWYADESELESDAAVVARVHHNNGFGQPVVFAEQGNDRGNWDPRSAVRYRIRSWAALLAESSLISWDYSALKDPRTAFGALYIGPEERGYVRALAQFASRIGPATTPVPSTPSTGLRSYALAGGTGAWAYVVNAMDHSAPTRGASLWLASPVDGTATFVSPATGTVLGSSPVRRGSNVLWLPAFTTDLAVAIGKSIW